MSDYDDDCSKMPAAARREDKAAGLLSTLDDFDDAPSLLFPDYDSDAEPRTRREREYQAASDAAKELRINELLMAEELLMEQEAAAQVQEICTALNLKRVPGLDGEYHHLDCPSENDGPERPHNYCLDKDPPKRAKLAHQ